MSALYSHAIRWEWADRNPREITPGTERTVWDGLMHYISVTSHKFWTLGSVVFILLTFLIGIGLGFSSAKPDAASEASEADTSLFSAATSPYFLEIDLSPGALARAAPAVIGACYFFGYIVEAAALSTYGLTATSVVSLSYLSAGIWLFSLFFPPFYFYRDCHFLLL